MKQTFFLIILNFQLNSKIHCISRILQVIGAKISIHPSFNPIYHLQAGGIFHFFITDTFHIFTFSTKAL